MLEEENLIGDGSGLIRTWISPSIEKITAAPAGATGATGCLGGSGAVIDDPDLGEGRDTHNDLVEFGVVVDAVEVQPVSIRGALIVIEVNLFGMISDDTEIRVWDSTAELRYMVLPERPQGTEPMSEKELAEMITRDSMIGVAKIAPPDK